MSQHITNLEIVTSEPVTPDHIAMRVAQACGDFGALRPGEGVVLPSNPSVLIKVTKTPSRSPFDKQ